MLLLLVTKRAFWSCFNTASSSLCVRVSILRVTGETSCVREYEISIGTSNETTAIYNLV